jgi:hypothetical protein
MSDNKGNLKLLAVTYYLPKRVYKEEKKVYNTGPRLTMPTTLRWNNFSRGLKKKKTGYSTFW